MANPDFLDVLGDEMGRVYEACHDRLLINLARHFKYLKPGEEPGGAFEYQAQKLAEFGQVTQESVSIIRGMLEGADPALAGCLESAIMDALDDVEPALRKAAEAGLLGVEAPPEVSPRTMGAFETYYRQSADKLNLVNTVMLESTGEAYRETVADITARMQRAQTIVDTATGKVVSGVESFNQALKQATRQMVANGITGFVDHGGHRWKPETYVAMDMRTTFHNVSRRAFWDRNEEYANDLYLVSQHPGARPLCYPWQCKVISRNDEARDVTDGAGNPVHVWAQSETTYGEPAGLFGINCGHHPMLFVPGATMVPDLMQNEEENAKAYAESQKQRGLEREFRKARLDLDVAKAQGAGKEELDRLRGHLQDADERLNRFEQETGRRRRREREYAPVNAKWPEQTTSAGSGRTFVVNAQVPGAEVATRDTYSSVYYSDRASYKITLENHSTEVNEGLSEAIRDVAKKGSETGFEHLHLVNLKTGKLDFYETNRSPDSVGFGFREYIKANPNEQYAFVHNHNTDGSFSAADVRTLVSNPQIPVMVAARNDGVVYVAERKDGMLVSSTIEDLYPNEIDALRADLKRGIITPAGYAKRMERLIVDNILRDYTKGGRLIEYDTRDN